MYNEVALPLEVGSVKMIDPEFMDDCYVSDQNNSDSDDGEIPYFSDVEAMVKSNSLYFFLFFLMFFRFLIVDVLFQILEMDLTHAQESFLTSEGSTCF